MSTNMGEGHKNEWIKNFSCVKIVMTVTPVLRTDIDK